MSNDTFGGRVKELRKSLGLTQDELANALNVTKGTVSVWERNGRRPDFDTLVGISKFFNVNMGYLICEDQTTEMTIPEYADSAEQVELRRIKSLALKLSQLSDRSLEIVEGTINVAYKTDQDVGELKSNTYSISIQPIFEK